MSAAADYELVVGLEVHVQLATRSKLFSPGPVRYGEAPNHAVHPVDLGLPGVLPVLNRHAVMLALRAAVATHCTVARRSVFARKNYFYPDLPKGYQISQYEEPLARGGWLELEGGRGEAVPGGSAPAAPAAAPTRRPADPVRIRIHRIHLEEDAGKSIHDPELTGPGSHVDFNRAGIPLLEIVSEPDLRSAAEAGAYLRKLRQLLRHIGVTEGDLEKGQFRCDVNVSLRPPGASQLGTRCELKNLNSFRFVEAAIGAEAGRQARVLAAGEVVRQATLLFDPERGVTRLMRSKENADDYRYFPDPDLLPLEIEEAEIEAVRRSMPELPGAARARFGAQYGLSDYVAEQLSATPSLGAFFEAAVAASPASGAPRAAEVLANWLLRDVREALREAGRSLGESALRPEALAALVGLVGARRLGAANARQVLAVLVEMGGEPGAIARERGLESLSDGGQLEAAVAAVLTAHPEMAEKFRSGESKVLNFLIGQVMRETRGAADPAAARELLLRAVRGGDAGGD